MIKKTIKETINEYDENGKLVKQTIKETIEEDKTEITYPSNIPVPYTPPVISPIWSCESDSTPKTYLNRTETKTDG